MDELQPRMARISKATEEFFVRLRFQGFNKALHPTIVSYLKNGTRKERLMDFSWNNISKQFMTESSGYHTLGAHGPGPELKKF